MEIKIILGIISALLAFVCFVPYIRDILKGKTKPHLFSWLIWGIFQGMNVIIALNYGGGAGQWALAIGAALQLVVAGLCIKYGTKNIKPFDYFCLVIAVVAGVLWFVFKSPVISILLLVATDFAGYLPTLRKSYQEPWTETLSTWVISVAANILSLFAISTYSFNSTFSLAVIFVSNLVCVVILIARRRQVPRM